MDVLALRDVHFPPSFLRRGPLLWVFIFDPKGKRSGKLKVKAPSPSLGGEGALCFSPKPRRTSRVSVALALRAHPQRSDPPEANTIVGGNTQSVAACL